MIITIKTLITFRLPEEKEIMEQFEQNDSDWVLDDDIASQWHCTPTTNTATYRRTRTFEVGADWIGGEDE